MYNWILAARLKTLPAGISPVIVGVSLAIHDGTFHVLSAFMTLLASILLQIGSNFANDVYDFLNGADTDDRIGPKRVVQAGLIAPKKMIKGMLLIFSFAIVIGIYLAFVGGWKIVAVGCISIFAAIVYTGGPYPLGYYGWGDLMVFLFFGIIAVPGTYYLQTGFVSNISILFGIALGSLSTSILAVNNLRDADTDSLIGKNTLAVRFGKLFVKIEYMIMMASAFFILFYVIYLSDKISFYIVLFLLPICISNIRLIFTESGESLNLLLNRTSKFLFQFSILLSISLIL